MRPSSRRAVAVAGLLVGVQAVGPARWASAEEIFSEVAASVGLELRNHNGAGGNLYICEPMGSGGAFVDYDDDGDLDVYLLQGQMLDGEPDPALRDRLFRNDPTTGEGGRLLPRFVDVTAASGIESLGYGMGVATGDYDNDGDTDLYVANLGPNLLLRNNGDGTFTDVTQEANADDPRHGVSVTFVDYDRDGWLDLFIGNYTDFTVATHKNCRSTTGARDYCGPLAYNPVPDRLLHNLGNGTFERVTEASGIAEEYGYALGVITADFNRDGWIDLYVANDQVPNQMWVNNGDGTFVNDALFNGTALNAEGRPEASMGVAVADIDMDGDEDLFLGHITRETNTLYINDGEGFFEDVSTASGLGGPSWEMTGFGNAWIDYDNNGLLDLLQVNGAVTKLEHLVLQNDPYPLHQKNSLYRNLGGNRFEEIGASSGSYFELSEVSRGVAPGDLDHDGDLDVLQTNNEGPVRLLINNVGAERAWLGVRLLGHTGRDMLDATVAVERAGQPVLWHRVRTGGSYISARDPRVLFGLGDATAVEAVRIAWPDGRRQVWRIGVVRRFLTFRQSEKGSSS